MDVREAWEHFTEKPWVQKTAAFCKKAGFVLALTSKWAYKLRSFVLSIPVFICAVVLAIRNVKLLPQHVGINMLESGQYQWVISRGIAVMFPLAVTILCLVLVLSSKKVLYPWLISVFSLALPLVIWFTNTFPS